MTNDSTKYAASIGTDGTRRVVWGVGSGADLDEATAAAQADAAHWLDDAEDPEHATIETIAIDRATYERVIAGDVSAEGLLKGAPMHVHEGRLSPALIDDVKGFAEDDNGTRIDWDAGVEIVSGEGEGEGTVEEYDGEHTAAALRERLEEERDDGDRWAYARPAGSTMREERYTFEVVS